MDVVLSARSASKLDDLLSNFSDFEIANEDWNDSLIIKK